MKRDFDLIRNILLQLEGKESRFEEVQIEPIGGHSAESVYHHYIILKQAGLIEGRIFAEIPFLANLTWEGHAFLENARNQTVWEKTREFVKNKGVSVSIEVFTELLKQTAKKQFNLE